MTDDDEDVIGDDIAMQVRCVHCLREQYALAVMAVSLGEAGCVWCGAMSKPMTIPAYRHALAAARQEKDS